MKRLKILFTVIAVMFVSAAFSVTAYAEEEPIYTNGVYKYTVIDSKATIVGLEGVTNRHLVIPESLDGYPVAGVGEKALYHDRIREITFPSTLECMDNNAFSWLVNDICIPSVEDWVKVEFEGGSPSFSNLKNIYIGGELVTDLVIPEGVTEIGAYAFYQMKSIKSVKIPSSVKKIGTYAFGYMELDAVYVESVEAWINTCAAMESVNNSMWHPMSSAEKFYVGDKLLADLVIPESVTEIPALTFYGVDTIENITFHSGITRVGDGAFLNCTYVKNLYLPDVETWFNFDLNFKNKNRKYENIYFAGELANELVIPEGITELPEYAFAKWVGLKSVTFPESLKKVGANAFVGCETVESVYAPSLEYWLGIDFASSGSNPLCAVSKLYLDGNVLESLQLPEGITEIKPYAFNGYRGIGAFTVTGETMKIGNGAFVGSEGMKIYADSVEEWFSIAFENRDANPLGDGAVLYLGGEIATEIVIPETVSTIPKYAFAGYKDLKKITIPANTGISLFSFYESGVTEVVIGSLTEEVEAKREITLATFSCFTKLEKITFGYGVKNIDETAFKGRKKLKEVNFCGNLERIGAYAFYETGIKELTIPSTVKYVGVSAFEKCADLKEITLGTEIGCERVCYIDERAFYGSKGLETVNINSGISTVGEYAFYNASNLKVVNVNDLYSYLEIDFRYSNPTVYADTVYYEGEVLKNLVIPDGIRTIGHAAFYNCKTLETVTFPDGLDAVWDYAFAGCTNLKDFVFPKSLTWIGAYAFLRCNSLTKLEFTENIRTIYGSAFSNCKNIKIVYMYPQQLELGKYTFSGCSNIKVILYTGTEEAWNMLIAQNKETGLEEIPVFFSYRPESMYAPEGLDAAQTDDSIRLEWSKINGVTGYRVFMKTNSGWTALKTLKNNSYEVTGLESGTKYTFAVKAYVNTGALVLWSPNYATVNTATTTVKPSKLTAQQNSSAIKLSWAACEGATGYRIYYKTSGGWKIAISTTSSTSHTFTGLKAGAKYTFAIRPYIKNGSEVIWSPYAEFTTATKPSAVSVKAESRAKGAVSLTWNSVKGAEGYQIWYKVDGGSFKKYMTLGETTGVSITGFKSGKYTFAVRAGIKTSGGNIFGAYKEATVTVK